MSSALGRVVLSTKATPCTIRTVDTQLPSVCRSLAMLTACSPNIYNCASCLCPSANCATALAVCTHTQTQTRTQTHAQTDTQTHAHTDTHAHRHTHARTDTHAHAHTHTSAKRNVKRNSVLIAVVACQHALQAATLNLTRGISGSHSGITKDVMCVDW